MRPRRSSRPPSPDAHKRRADRHLDTRTGRAEPQSRRELTSSAVVGDFQTVRTGAGRLAQPHVTANVGDPPTSWRLGGLAREKQRRPHHHPLEEPIAHPPDRSRKAAKPQRARQKRGRWGPPDHRHQRGTLRTTSASPRPLAPPQTSLRLCASARDKQRRPHHHPLEEPISAKPRQVAQSRRAAESSPQTRSFGDTQTVGIGAGRLAQLRVTAMVGDPPTSWRLGGLAREKQRRPHHHPLEEPIAHPTDRSRKAAKPQRARQKRGRWGPPDPRHQRGTLKTTSASP
jgi:hypothetical protein